jgi:hypothetical protein
VIRIRIAAFLFSTSLMSNNALWIPCRSKALSTVLRSCDTFMLQTAFRGGGVADSRLRKFALKSNVHSNFTSYSVKSPLHGRIAQAFRVRPLSNKADFHDDAVVDLPRPREIEVTSQLNPHPNHILKSWPTSTCCSTKDTQSRRNPRGETHLRSPQRAE